MNIQRVYLLFLLEQKNAQEYTQTPPFAFFIKHYNTIFETNLIYLPTANRVPFSSFAVADICKAYLNYYAIRREQNSYFSTIVHSIEPRFYTSTYRIQLQKVDRPRQTSF